MNNSLRVATGLVGAVLCTNALAYETGDWVARVGAHRVNPQGDNHEVVSVEGATSVTGGVTYFVAPHFGIDLLLAAPFKHDIELESDGSKVGSTRHLPPTLSLMWYPDLSERLQPFLGMGLNYTTFFEEQTSGALEGAKLRLDDSFGVAFAAGLEYRFATDLSVIVDVRYFEIDTHAHLDGASLGKVHIDPMAFGAAIGYRF